MNAGHGLELSFGDYQKQVNIRIKELKDQHFVEKLWQEETLSGSSGRLLSEKGKRPPGWMTAPVKMMRKIPQRAEFKQSLVRDGFKNIVLLGMGGSSMTSLVFQQMVKEKEGDFQFFVLDSTD